MTQEQEQHKKIASGPPGFIKRSSFVNEIVCEKESPSRVMLSMSGKGWCGK